MMNIVKSLNETVNSFQLISDVIPQTLNIVVGYRENIETSLRSLEAENFVMLFVIALFVFFLHHTFSSIKQSLPKPRGKE